MDVLPKEKEGADLPVSSAFDGDAPKENEGADADVASLEGDPDAPKLNEGEDVEDAPKLNPFEAGAALGDPFAPPKDSCGVVPSGPNLPSLAGGSVEDEVNFLLSGVVAASGPDGAKEKRPPDAGFEPKENFGVSSFFSSFLSSFFSPSILSSSARTSATILFTASEAFLGVAAAASTGAVWGTGAQNEGGLVVGTDGAARELPLDLVGAGTGSGFHPAFFSAS